MDISVDLVAPARDGIYMGGWVLQDSQGLSFAENEKSYILCWAMIEVKRFRLPSILSSDDDKYDRRECIGGG